MNRKDEHISLARAFHQKPKENDFDNVRLIHSSLVNTRPEEIDLSTEILGLKLSAPFYINAMTGGSEKTKKINHDLAIIARETNLMMATGSVSAALKDPSVADSYTVVREVNPHGLILGNMGAGRTSDDAKKIVDLLQADGFQIHLNVPQELVMPEGDRDFHEWSKNIAETVQQLAVPVIVKEVGFGMNRETIQQLQALGVKAVDVSGRGGTSFSQIENARRKKRELNYLDDWGQSTVISLLEAQEINDLTLLASGGIRNAYDIFKALCLGAKAVGISAGILDHLISNGIDATVEMIEDWKIQLRRLYLMTDKVTTADLVHNPIILSGAPKEWCEARGIDYKKLALRS
ncbi:type 2 isopentenyl-diphosphate Delta-isomerase [Enterococcus hulanensis]|uniref:Isopentenyl-diphosphate delta-isomerase n=1 Tax=Enterococcus hulanensis TaxID=2559929 RepID=A0ABU3F0M5_9ENTE|nr:type 2 isopentenyl-diphosphate Delta-isomerase [Enterococcus hulanensis]MDT2600672.1 type 2 isopentenyl-diphosphate Delta-isomerase [Enterococcus hulanensis]MDT2610195.1 type 2 isopentenyl-diphosphate Delta-isomerase [Enterococcus hulanensis]MDT2617397.1 type 2 isopentenyl-diphosphate Delta-isomerase [Enterococcus hulanensis]MDT2628140.1 type 2 isopentenyl-diphosphate Delta-isomerase [Enterococcus hulanensis]MDT2655245.1 type 2 isopentenyl-diphosphate Delta-isomerase [Enterococcus hulanensi